MTDDMLCTSPMHINKSYMNTTDFAYDGPIFLVPLSPSYPSSPVLVRDCCWDDISSGTFKPGPVQLVFWTDSFLKKLLFGHEEILRENFLFPLFWTSNI